MDYLRSFFQTSAANVDLVTITAGAHASGMTYIQTLLPNGNEITPTSGLIALGFLMLLGGVTSMYRQVKEDNHKKPEPEPEPEPEPDIRLSDSEEEKKEEHKKHRHHRHHRHKSSDDGSKKHRKHKHKHRHKSKEKEEENLI